MRTNCESCGESYDDENLDDCVRCGNSVCYECCSYPEEGGEKVCVCNDCENEAQEES